MKVLQINAVNGIRSTGRIITEISDYLNNNGHEGYVAYSVGLAYMKGYQIGTSFDKKVHALCSRAFGNQSYYSRISTKKLIKYIANIRPDVIHLHNLHDNYINLKLLLDFLAIKDIPTVVTLHDCWFYTGKCTHYTVDNCYKWKIECGKCPRLRKDNKSWFFDRTAEMLVDKKEWFGSIPRLAVVGVSDWITNEAKDSLLSTGNIITRIYNWIDLDIFKPVGTTSLRKKLNLENKYIILGVSSGWSKAKGLDKFIELSKIIPNEMVILLVGNIDGNIELPKNIVHINETHNINELVEYYSLSDVFLNLSLEESFGKVTVEALACGTPVIVADSTANPELVGKGCGYIIKDLNIIEILNHINIIKSNSKVLYSSSCVEYAHKNFNKNDRIRDYIELYEEMT